MSAVSKVVLGVSVAVTAGTVAGVHLRQQLDREKLREGVFRDLERQEHKKKNLRLLEEQIILTNQLEADRVASESIQKSEKHKSDF
ncbi:protein PET117 homolog, mitochondrial [Callorhinchus milii]|uniref:Cytochrome c oxidase assembly factor-like protein n=1 Tax=Callorhinchus milii TaxID=7868 RepID=V9LKE0_CALMI|nr:protein PET117 homolog, mitochondrial [Callorhinchus milii]|eukprot:gi/632953812/ref/XP_007892626.1/ PREDICTED: protein PET117 homolog, mitochondrial [Callorhinchus milii]